MEALLAVLIGVFFAAGTFLILRRSFVRVIIGLALLAHGANLTMFLSAGLTRGKPPLIPQGESAPIGPFGDPLPQALVLTAIVIAFGILAFALVLFQKAYQRLKTDDIDDIKSSDAPPSQGKDATAAAKSGGEGR